MAPVFEKQENFTVSVCLTDKYPNVEAFDVVYQYWCEGEPRIRIKIRDVAFADGTEWSAPESPSPEKHGAIVPYPHCSQTLY